MENFTILVIYNLKNDGDREAIVKEMTESGVLNAIRNEDGCYIYDYYYPVENAKQLVLYEKWESIEHQKVHMTQPHMKTAKEITGKYVESVSVKKIDLSDLQV